jgi:hypothetical protein
VLSSKDADLIGASHAAAEPPASIRSLTRHGTFLLARALRCTDGPTRDERSTRLNLRIKNSHFGTIAAVDVKAKFATARCLHPPCTFTPGRAPPRHPRHDRGPHCLTTERPWRWRSRLIFAMSRVERVVISWGRKISLQAFAASDGQSIGVAFRMMSSSMSCPRATLLPAVHF